MGVLYCIFFLLAAHVLAIVQEKDTLLSTPIFFSLSSQDCRLYVNERKYKDKNKPARVQIKDKNTCSAEDTGESLWYFDVSQNSQLHGDLRNLYGGAVSFSTGASKIFGSPVENRLIDVVFPNPAEVILKNSEDKVELNWRPPYPIPARERFNVVVSFTESEWTLNGKSVDRRDFISALKSVSSFYIRGGRTKEKEVRYIGNLVKKISLAPSSAEILPFSSSTTAFQSLSRNNAAPASKMFLFWGDVLTNERTESVSVVFSLSSTHSAPRPPVTLCGPSVLEVTIDAGTSRCFLSECSISVETAAGDFVGSLFSSNYHTMDNLARMTDTISIPTSIGMRNSLNNALSIRLSSSVSFSLVDASLSTSFTECGISGERLGVRMEEESFRPFKWRPFAGAPSGSQGSVVSLFINSQESTIWEAYRFLVFKTEGSSRETKLFDHGYGTVVESEIGGRDPILVDSFYWAQDELAKVESRVNDGFVSSYGLAKSLGTKILISSIRNVYLPFVSPIVLDVTKAMFPRLGEYLNRPSQWRIEVSASTPPQALAGDGILAINAYFSRKVSDFTDDSSVYSGENIVMRFGSGADEEVIYMFLKSSQKRATSEAVLVPLHALRSAYSVSSKTYSFTLEITLGDGRLFESLSRDSDIFVNGAEPAEIVRVNRMSLTLQV
mmetsp:Transcript_46855/g.120728  ORF Transcript_46855/g.120728 Transcript_46855/m.120728 type:complete len:667 (-) Transcript_46855:112-2112(-)